MSLVLIHIYRAYKPVFSKPIRNIRTADRVMHCVPFHLFRNIVKCFRQQLYTLARSTSHAINHFLYSEAIYNNLFELRVKYGLYCTQTIFAGQDLKSK